MPLLGEGASSGGSISVIKQDVVPPAHSLGSMHGEMGIGDAEFPDIKEHRAKGNNQHG